MCFCKLRAWGSCSRFGTHLSGAEVLGWRPGWRPFALGSAAVRPSAEVQISYKGVGQAAHQGQLGDHQ
jgi:hypothetical protein